MQRIVPRRFWGSIKNFGVILKSQCFDVISSIKLVDIDKFIRLRKYETMSMGEIMAGFKV